MRNSRVAALQILYQLEFFAGEKDIEAISQDIYKFYLGDYKKKSIKEIVNIDFITKITQIYIDKKEDILQEIEEHLQKTWKIEEVSLILKIILTLGIAEIIATDTELPIIYNEYIEIAKVFENNEDARFANSILEKLGQKIRK